MCVYRRVLQEIVRGYSCPFPSCLHLVDLSLQHLVLARHVSQSTEGDDYILPPNHVRVRVSRSTYRIDHELTSRCYTVQVAPYLAAVISVVLHIYSLYESLNGKFTKLKQGLRQRIIDFEENERQKLLELIQADGHLLESRVLEGKKDLAKVQVGDWQLQWIDRHYNPRWNSKLRMLQVVD